MFGDASVYEWAGYTGVAFYLISYSMLQMGLIRGAGYAYTLMNLTAACLVLVSLTQAFNMSAAIIQSMWILISVIGLCRLFILHSTMRFNDEERALIKEGLKGMPMPMCRKILDRGFWSNAAPGTELTVEGHDVSHLHFLLDGAADVRSGGQSVAEIRQGFIGEMNVMEPGAATATVVVGSPSRLFSVAGEELRRMARADSEFRAFLEQHLSLATRRKLVEANARMTGANA